MRLLPAILLAFAAAVALPSIANAAPKTKAPLAAVAPKAVALPASVISSPKKLKAVSNVLSAIRKNSALSKPLTAIRAKSASGKSLSEQFGRLSKVKKPISLDYIKRVQSAEYAGKVFPASKLSKTFSKRYPAGIQFNERGYPDLSQYATKTVQIEPQGNSAKDARAADIAAGFTKDNPRPGRYYWYHSEQNGTLQLVPKDMIGALRKVKNSSVNISPGDGGGRLNLFKWGKKSTEDSNSWKEGDFMLNLPDMGDPSSNWAQNSSLLRAEMRKKKPIYDSYRDPETGARIPTEGFLRAERNLLESNGWIYDQSTGAYHPPALK